MKIIPPDPPSSDPENSGPKTTPRATTTRFLRLTPSRDVPATAPLPAARPRPSSTPLPAAITPPVFVPPAEPVPPPAPEPAAVLPPPPEPVEPAPAAIFPPAAKPPTSPTPLRLPITLPQKTTSGGPPAHQPDDRPMRLTTKRLPNVFAAAPSARWSPPGGAAVSTPLRIIPPSVLATASDSQSLLLPPEPSPALATEISPAFIPPMRPAPEPAEIIPDESAVEEPPSPEIMPDEYIPEPVIPEPVAEEPAPPKMAAPEPVVYAPTPEPPPPAPITFSPTVPAIAEKSATVARPPPPGGQRLTAPPIPLSRLTKTERHSLGRGFWILLAVLILIILVLLYVFGLTPRIVAGQELDHEQKFSTERVVVYGVARLATPHVELPLPGTIEAFQQASLYARTNGYVKKWLVDIGDQVTTGQLLAELDTPEVDQQLAQAQAAEAQAQASLNIAQSAAQRWDTMAKAKAVSQEDADEKDATNNEAQASFNAAHANVARLTDLENFKQIRAPFPGKITYRNIDVGSLVTAGAGAPNSELFRVAQTDPLRVYVDVPESNAPAIKPGVQANIQVTSYPGRIFHGEVVRNAGALSDSSRTLRTEIHVANPDGALLPGAFAEVRLQLLDSAPAVLIPANALIVNATGTSVALVQDHYGHDVVHYASVHVGRDFGTEVEILDNVHQGDRLVTNPPADMNDGAAVTAKPGDTPSAPSVSPPAPSTTRA
jgi:RND family efflux transporter MFP subunit